MVVVIRVTVISIMPKEILLLEAAKIAISKTDHFLLQMGGYVCKGQMNLYMFRGKGVCGNDN